MELYRIILIARTRVRPVTGLTHEYRHYQFVPGTIESINDRDQRRLPKEEWCFGDYKMYLRVKVPFRLSFGRETGISDNDPNSTTGNRTVSFMGEIKDRPSDSMTVMPG